MAHGGPRELQRQRRETRMVAREVTRADGDVVGAAVAEALVDVAITEVIAEDVVVAETEETGAREAREVKEGVTAEAEGGRGDSMTTAEKTDGTIDLAVEGKKPELSRACIKSCFLVFSSGRGGYRGRGGPRGGGGQNGYRE